MISVKSLFNVVLGGFLCAAVGVSAQQVDEKARPWVKAERIHLEDSSKRSVSADLKEFESYRLDLELLAEQARSGYLRLRLGSHAFDLELRPNSMPGLQDSVCEFTPAISETCDAETERPLYQADLGDGKAHLIVASRMFRATFSSGADRLMVQPVRDFTEPEFPDTGPARDQVVVYSSRDVVSKQRACRQASPEPPSAETSGLKADLPKPGGIYGEYTATVVTDADAKFYGVHGACSCEVAADLISQASPPYDDTLVSLVLGDQHVWTDSDMVGYPYKGINTSGALLDQETETWDDVEPYSSWVRDFVFLFIEKDIDGGDNNGSANTGTTWKDRSLAYGYISTINPMNTQVFVTAHEIGHLLGAAHICQDVYSGAEDCQECVQCDGETGPIMCPCDKKLGDFKFTEYSICTIDSHAMKYAPD